MTSRMRLDARRVVEQLGAARLTFDLCEAQGRLETRLMALHFMGVPCPRLRAMRTVLVAPSGPTEVWVSANYAFKNTVLGSLHRTL